MNTYKLFLRLLAFMLIVTGLYYTAEYVINRPQLPDMITFLIMAIIIAVAGLSFIFLVVMNLYNYYDSYLLQKTKNKKTKNKK